MNRDLTTAQTAGLISCHSCHLLCERGKPSADRLCPRCGASLHERKTQQHRANLGPGAGSLHFLHSRQRASHHHRNFTGQGPVGHDYERRHLFCSNRDVAHRPGNFFGQCLCTVAETAHSDIPVDQRAAQVQLAPARPYRLYRITEIIGRWSMVDIFVVTILVALVHLGGLATIQPVPERFFSVRWW